MCDDHYAQKAGSVFVFKATELLLYIPTTISSPPLKVKKGFKHLSYHLQRPLPQVPLSDQPLLVGDVESALSQRLDDGVVAQQGFRSVALQDEAAGPAVQVCRQQEAGHGRLQVLLLILVCVEGVLQVCWDAVCMTEGRERDCG